jgi:hypothetical protein
MMYNPSLDRTDDTAHGHCMALAAATRARSQGGFVIEFGGVCYQDTYPDVS